VHFHIDYLHFPVTRRECIKAVTTLHGRLDIPELAALYQEFWDMNLISISNAQRLPLVWANWVGTVYHGLPEDLYRPSTGPGKYLAFLGRISPEKRADRAIEIAIRAGIPIKIAAKVDRVDEEYFEIKIRKLLEHPLVEYIGEIGDRDKGEFLGNAHALLFPIDWPEPFGLVLIEAMACGTPLIAYSLGSVPEIIDQGTSGFMVNSIDEAVETIGRLGSIDRAICRKIFEQRFSARRMALDYVSIYSNVIRQNGATSSINAGDGLAIAG
jgi:glycosyltransferase involved in cell wall biosynthesis